MKKTMIKAIFALFIALSIFTYNSALTFAAVCDRAPDKVHHFDNHKMENAGYTKPGGTHKYLFGYVNNQPVYRYDCELTYVYQYCNYTCKYCGVRLDGGNHAHQISTKHSISHN